MNAFKADLLLVDGRNALWRAADKFDELSIVTDEGEEQTGAIYGFLTILCKAQATFGGNVIICWDDWVNGPTARTALYSQYKKRAGRASAGPKFGDAEKMALFHSMALQQTRLMWILGLFGIPQAFSEGWEADDVMGTIARRLGDGRNVGIYTGDRDMYQCATETVSVIRPQKGGEYLVCGPAQVREEYGIEPERFVELKALAGDTGDNIPGIDGIGPKTASAILQHFKTAEQACQWALGAAEARAKNWAYKWVVGITQRFEEKLAAGIESARLSKQLAEINCGVKLQWAPCAADRHIVTQEMVKLKFKTVLHGGRLERLLEMGISPGV